MRIEVDPYDSAFNSFVTRFTQALKSTGADVAPFDPSLRSLLRSDVVILHWPKIFMGDTSRRRALFLLAKLSIARLAGTKVVWVAHNVVSHDERVDRVALNGFLAVLSGVIYLSQASKLIVERNLALVGRKPALVTRHGRYDGRVPARAYEPPAAGEPVQLGNFGLIRRYKSLEDLIEAMDGLSPQEARLTITGRRMKSDYVDGIVEMVRSRNTVKLAAKDELLTEEELESVIDKAHGIVLPYRDILNSGAAIHALSRNRPVLAPSRGSIPELATQVGSDWVQTYEGKLTPDILRRFVVHLRGLERASAPDLSSLDWGSVEKELGVFLMRIAGTKAGGAA